MREVDIERINREFKDFGLTHKIEIFYIKASQILNKNLMNKMNDLLKDVNDKIDEGEEVSKEEVIEVLENIDNYLIEFNNANVRNKGGYGIELEYSLSILTIIINVRYFSPSGKVYYIDDEHFRVLSLYKKECDEGVNTIDTLKEYMKYYSEECDGRVDYKLNDDNEIETVISELDIEKMMDIMNLLADSTLDEDRKDKVNIDNIVYNVKGYHQFSKISLPKDYKIISFRILTNNIKLNLKDIECYKFELICEALSICIKILNNTIGIYQRDIANYGIKKKNSRYELDDVDVITILKNTIQEISYYQKLVFDNNGKDFNIDIKDTFILQLLYKGLYSLRSLIAEDMSILKHKLYYLNGNIGYKEKLDIANRKFDFCTKVIDITEPKYNNLKESKLIRGL